MNLDGAADDPPGQGVNLCGSVTLWQFHLCGLGVSVAVHLAISLKHDSATSRVSCGMSGNVPSTCSNSLTLN